MVAATLAASLTAALAACTPPATPPTSPTPTASASPSRGATPVAVVDLTVPGAAARLVDRIVAAAGSRRVIMVQITPTDAAVSVVKDGAAQTWALRDGTIKQVQSDLTYVSQATFTPSEFNLTDVGALFRAAAAVSGSTDSQALQIVDFSGGQVWMTVSTNPESRTVFFRKDGTLLPTLDFSTAAGIEQGLNDVVGGRELVSELSVGSSAGAWIDFPGTEKGTTVRRQRIARVPTTESVRNDAASAPLFNPQAIQAGVLYAVLQRRGTTGSYRVGDDWSVSVTERGDGRIRMRWSVAGQQFTTNTAGVEVSD